MGDDLALLFMSNEYINLLKQGSRLQDDRQRRGAFEEAIKLAPKNSNCYLCLALDLKEGETLEKNTKLIGKTDLLKFALYLDPNNGYAYYHLALMLDTSDEIVLDKASYSKQDLLMKAKEKINPPICDVFIALGDTLSKLPYEPYQPNNRMVRGVPTVIDCFTEAIRIQPNHPEAYKLLEKYLLPSEKVKLNINKSIIEMTKQELHTKYVELLFNSPPEDYPVCYISETKQEIRFKQTKDLDPLLKIRRELKKHPNSYELYNKLGCHLLDSDIELDIILDGNQISLNPIDLFLKSIAINPNFAKAYFSLGCALDDEEMITINGKEYTQYTLIETALKLDPNDEVAKFNFDYIKKKLLNPVKMEKVYSNDSGPSSSNINTISDKLKSLSIDPNNYTSDLKTIKIGEISLREEFKYGNKTKIYAGNYNGKNVAVKVFTNKIDFRYTKQAKHLSDNYSKHFVPILGLGRNEKQHWTIVMEKMKSSLSDIIYNPTRISHGRQIEVALQIADGLKILEEHDIQLLNLWPKNILIDYRGNVKFGDFIAYQQTEDHKKWQAPEVLERTPHPKSDIFSFGIIIIELNLQPQPNPFRSNSRRISELGKMTIKREIDRMSHRLLADLVEACIEENPDNRLSASMIVEELESIGQNSNTDEEF